MCILTLPRWSCSNLLEKSDKGTLCRLISFCYICTAGMTIMLVDAEEEELVMSVNIEA